jgi:ribokinase
MTESQVVSALNGLPEFDLVIGQLEIPQEVTAAAFERARELGAATILNPAPFDEIMPRLLQASDWIIPNETEFEGLHPRHLAPASDEIISETALHYGCRFAVTLGAAGAALTTTEGEVVRIEAPRVEVVDTTGAGDAFVGAFAVGLVFGFSEVKAAELGCACASDSTTRPGTQSSYLTRQAASEFLS